MTKTAKLWSVVEGQYAHWDLGVEETAETKDPDNSVTGAFEIVARYKDEVLKFSPSYTKEELEKALNDYNAEHADSKPEPPQAPPTKEDQVQKIQDVIDSLEIEGVPK